MIKFYYLDSNGRRHDKSENAVEAELGITLANTIGPVIQTSKLARKVEELEEAKSNIYQDLKTRVLADIG